MLLNKFFKLRINSGDTADFWDLVSAWLQRTELREFFPQFFSDGCHDNSNSTSFWYKTLLYYSLPLLFRVIRISASSIFENTSKKGEIGQKFDCFLLQIWEVKISSPESLLIILIDLRLLAEWLLMLEKVFECFTWKSLPSNI